MPYIGDRMRHGKCSVRNKYCVGCTYDDIYSKICLYMIITGQKRECAAGEGCVHKKVEPRKRKDIMINPIKKRILLTEEQKRNKRNALRRKANEIKKAALSATNTENGDGNRK